MNDLTTLLLSLELDADADVVGDCDDLLAVAVVTYT